MSRFLEDPSINPCRDGGFLLLSREQERISAFAREEPIHESKGPSGVSGVREVLRKGGCLLKNERAIESKRPDGLSPVLLCVTLLSPEYGALSFDR